LTLQQKKPLSNFFSQAFLAALFILPLAFALVNRRFPPYFFLPPLLGVISIFIFKTLRNNIFTAYHGDFDNYNEKINILKEGIAQREKVNRLLPLQKKRMAFLFNVSHDLTGFSDIEAIYDFLTGSFVDLFPSADNLFVYEFDRENGALALKRSRKPFDDPGGAEAMDSVDVWVLRHNQTLIIEDITKDFRFDCNSLRSYTQRQVRSLIVSPLSIAHKISGLARLESKEPNSFSLDDSRFIRNICDLGAVVLERANLFAYAQNLATRDPLTSLFLRDYFNKRLKIEVKESLEKNIPLGVILADIDNFKQINDDHGHIVGDAILKKISRLLLKLTGGAGNLVSRFGGEEFIMLINNITPDELKRLAEDVRGAVASAGLLYRRKKIIFTISCGVSFLKLDGIEPTALIAAADRRLYIAKNKGKNKICYSG
jgi:diguanylate cyclase (GGDEF)-like protein